MLGQRWVPGLGYAYEWSINKCDLRVMAPMYAESRIATANKHIRHSQLRLIMVMAVCHTNVYRFALG